MSAVDVKVVSREASAVFGVVWASSDCGIDGCVWEGIEDGEGEGGVVVNLLCGIECFILKRERRLLTMSSE